MAYVDQHSDQLDPAALQPSPLMWQRPRAVCMVLALIGLLGAVIGWSTNPGQFYYSWLSSWSFCWTTMMGVLFFVMLHHLVDAGWSTVVRRPAEHLLAAMPVILLAGIPIVIGMYIGKLHRWMYADPLADELLAKKTWFLNHTFLAARLTIYALTWAFLALRFRRNSLRQDADGAAHWTISSRRWSAGGMVLYALTISFCAFDLLMALDDHWFSTVFGVYVWSGGVVGGLCVITLISLALKRGPLQEYIGSDQVHSLGQLNFAFCVFWGYIAFSQFILIWYGNIPEETIFYLKRWSGASDQGTSWWIVSIILPLGRFLLPFLVLMSAHTKRNVRIVIPMCFALLFFHWLDQYWMVMPEKSPDYPPLQYLWIDASVIALIAGACGMIFISALRKSALLPLQDPRLAEALAAEHVDVTERSL